MLGTSAAIFSALLIVTGLAKLRRPEETTRALGAFGVPAHRSIGLAIGFAELLLGATALALGNSVLFAVQSVLYLAFGIWVFAASRLDVPLASCGCLGRDDTPPYWGHLILDFGAAMLSAGAAFADTSPLPVGASAVAVSHWIVVAVGVFLAWMVIDHGARLHGAVRAS